VWNARSQAAIPLVAPLSTMPPVVSGYAVQDQHLSDEERRVAGMTSYVARVYSRDSIPAFTTFVSYYDRQTQGKTIHSPKNCLPGAGWEVLTAGTATIAADGAVHEVNRVVLKNQGETAVVYYWYQGRGRIVANEYAVKANLLNDAAFSGHTEEALVRVFVPVVVPGASGREADDNPAFVDASSLGEEISARLMHEVDRVLPRH
jgi:EpsI family protein